MKNVQSLVEYGVKEGWSTKKIQEEVNKEMRGKGVEITNEDIVEMLDKSGKAATIVGIYPAPQTKPFAIAGGVLGAASIFVDNKKTWKQKIAELSGSALGSLASGGVFNSIPVPKDINDKKVLEGIKNAHNAISGEIGGKIPETYNDCQKSNSNGNQKLGC